MLENCHSATERWDVVNKIIDHWLQERRALLVDLCSLSAIDNFDEKNPEHDRQVRHFCQTLVDYLSVGHFEVYDQLVKEGQEFNDKKGLNTAAEIYKIIDATTESLLNFNDKYQETDDLSSLTWDLSQTGQKLESRFEAEDQMIRVLHYAHGK